MNSYRVNKKYRRQLNGQGAWFFTISQGICGPLSAIITYLPK